ncbi:MAG: hypothetical protein WCF77_04385 [Minisyncoccia bacterium]|jgi:hypothetical protein
MERTTSISEARKIFGDNFIGGEELSRVAERTGIGAPREIPPIPFSEKYLREKGADHFLVLGISRFESGAPLTLMSLRDRFGTDPDKEEPCFYNQDWYAKEDFANQELEDKWFLVRKSIFEESRAKEPDALARIHTFPSAVLCAYAFFVTWYVSGEPLWPHDFVWCSDVDHNGDRIYVGRYRDPAGINKNGFNVHRHLRVRGNYGSVEVF